MSANPATAASQTSRALSRRANTIARRVTAVALRLGFSAAVALALAPALWTGMLRAAQPLAMLEEQAMMAAVARVAPSVVRIETVGGLERIGAVLVGSGSTTGLVVSPDGYIISSAFNFAQRPDSILVTLAGGARTAAKLVATDYDRKLVLLKIEPSSPLPVPEAAPSDQIRVGQWALALGRTFDGDRPSVSVGIVSAVGRIWDKAIQTDAKISPSNYGGPLVDIRGRVLGILSPLAPEAGNEVAGVDWYDSGIGFAAPFDHVLSVVPRMKAGHDLRPGLLGVSFKSADHYSPPAVIGACWPNSPAFKAGLRAGDEVIEADGRPVTRFAQLKTVLGGHYAGDHVRLAARRGGERLEFDVELADKMAPFDRPFLGILPRRDVGRDPEPADEAERANEPADDHPAEKDAENKDAENKDAENKTPKDDAAAGDGPAATKSKANPLVIRYVYPGGPADRAGLVAGDAIRAADGKPVADAAALAARLSALAPGEKIELGFDHNGASRQVAATLDRLPQGLPDEPPPARDAPPAPGADRPQVGSVQIKLPEFANGCLAWVPETYNPAVAYGLLVWLHGAETVDDEAIVARWKQICSERDLILLAPKSADPARWQLSEAKLMRRMMAEVAKRYRLDRSRIVIHGQDSGGALAYLVAIANRDIVRGVAVVDAALPSSVEPPETDPMRPLAIYTTRATKAPFTPQLEAGVKTLEEKKFPVTVINVGPHGRYLSAEELAGLGRWIDALDRL